MRKIIHGLVAASLLATPAVADVRPGNCQPVLPVLDQPQAAMTDVTSQPVGPTAPAKRRFLGLPLLLLPLLAGGALAALTGNGNPASPQ